MATQLSFFESQNLSQPYQMINPLHKIYDEVDNAPFVKVPAKYQREIAPKLPSAERHICDIVISKTFGWHRKSCKLTIKELMGGVYQIRSIQTAKASLLRKGLLVKYNGEYGIDIFYEKRVREETPPKPELQEEISYIEIPTLVLPGDGRIEEINDVVDVNPDTNNYVDNPEETQFENTVCRCHENVDNSTIPCVSKTQDFTDSLIVISSEGPILNLKKQTEYVAKTKEKKSFVCFPIPILSEISIYTGMSYDQTAKRCKGYSENDCKKALEILKDDCKRGVVDCPAAYFTTALKNKWVPNKPLNTKLEIRLRYERLAEKTHQDYVQNQLNIAEIESNAEFVASVRASMPESELSRLVAEARQFFLDNNVPYDLIKEFTIEHQVNAILLSRR